MLYKQRKFNLLRETNEGYSKLISEITSLVGPPHSLETGQPVESLATTRKRARAAWEKVVGIIGYFDLDPNRVLDVLLDVFSTYLIAHHRFFLELVRCSGWSRARVSPETAVSKGESTMAVDEATSNKYTDKSFEEVLKVAEQPLAKEASGTAGANPPILGDVLGFKFAHYQVSNSPCICKTGTQLLVIVITGPWLRPRYRQAPLLPHGPPRQGRFPRVV